MGQPTAARYLNLAILPGANHWSFTEHMEKGLPYGDLPPQGDAGEVRAALAAPLVDLVVAQLGGQAAEAAVQRLDDFST